MVIMNKTGLGAVGVAVAMSLAPASLGCGFGPDSALSPGSSSSETSLPRTAAASEEIGEDMSTSARAAKSRSGLVDTLNDQGVDRTAVRSLTASGTDSVTPESVPGLDEGVRVRLSRFGERYLSYDYREPPERRLDELAALVTPALFAELAAPLPPALAASLVEEQRVAVPELVSLVPLEALASGAGVYELAFAVTETTTPSGSTMPAERERVQTITVVLNAENLVEDVR